MKQRKRLKNRQNFIDQFEEDILPRKHEQLGNLNLYSEEVVKNIMELLISLTISTEFRKSTEAKINDFCISDFLHKTNNVVELFKLNIDKDDFNGPNYSISKNKYLKTDMNEKRHKIKIHKIAKNKRNYFANRIFYNLLNDNKYKEAEIIIKNKEIEDLLNKSTNEINKINIIKELNIPYDIEINKYKNNYWGDISQPKTSFIDRTSSLYNNLKTEKSIFKKINSNEKRIHKKIPTYRKKYSLNYKQKLNTLNEEVDPRKKKFVPILEMPFVELPKEENKNKETEEIQKIRKETLEVIEAKKAKMKMLEKNLKLKDKKEEISGKFTTDASGKIVLIKEIRPEDLLKDFYPLKYKQKELLGGIPLVELKKENALMEKKAEKNIIFNKPLNSRNTLNPNHFFSINKELDKEYKYDNNLFIKSLFEGETYRFPYHNKTNEQIILGGSNFKLMDPSPGVNIKERHLIKTGNLNFFQTYHRYSLDEFDKVLKDTLDNEKSKLSGNFLNKNLTNLTNDVLPKKEKLDMNKNLNANKIKNKHKKNNFRKTFSEGFRPKKTAQNPISQENTLTRKNSYNIQKLFVNEEDVININRLQKKKKLEKIMSYNNILNRNIITPSGRISKNKRKFNLSLMNNFNKDIMMGYFNFDKDENVLPILPQRKIKLNKLTKNININGMSRTTHNFYRTRHKRLNNLVQSLSTNIIRNNKI